MHSIEKYAPIVGDKVIADIYRKSRTLYGKHILHVNSTFQGGGVAELLNSLVQLFNDVGIDCGWRILHGNPTFFEITKKFHNAMQGDKIHLTNIKSLFIYQQMRLFRILHTLIMIVYLFMILNPYH